jgi:hypothetical protein
MGFDPTLTPSYVLRWPLNPSESAPTVPVYVVYYHQLNYS